MSQTYVHKALGNLLGFQPEDGGYYAITQSITTDGTVPPDRLEGYHEASKILDRSAAALVELGAEFARALQQAGMDGELTRRARIYVQETSENSDLDGICKSLRTRLSVALNHFGVEKGFKIPDLSFTVYDVHNPPTSLEDPTLEKKIAGIKALATGLPSDDQDRLLRLISSFSAIWNKLKYQGWYGLYDIVDLLQNFLGENPGFPEAMALTGGAHNLRRRLEWFDRWHLLGCYYLNGCLLAFSPVQDTLALYSQFYLFPTEASAYNRQLIRVSELRRDLPKSFRAITEAAQELYRVEAERLGTSIEAPRDPSVSPQNDVTDRRARLHMPDEGLPAGFKEEWSLIVTKAQFAWIMVGKHDSRQFDAALQSPNTWVVRLSERRLRAYFNDETTYETKKEALGARPRGRKTVRRA